MIRKLFFVLFLLFAIFTITLHFSLASGKSLSTEHDYGSDPDGKIPEDLIHIPGARPIGNNACLSCHPVPGQAAEKYITPFFWKADVHSSSGHGGMKCEDCHGNGSRHAQADSSDFIFNPAKFQNKWKAQEVCTACHMQHESADLHGGTGVACLDCHMEHVANNPKFLKILPERELCYTCHASIKMEFNLPSHHPVNEGDMTCTSCHMAHFALARDNLVETRDVETCGACHPAERGPFVFQHISFEGCEQCHATHGSAQQYLLTVAQPALCLQCHLPTTDQFAFNYPYCTVCHIAIHGSNKQRLFQR